MISFIICTYNRSYYLKKCLDSLINSLQEINYCYEIIVVNNNSSDNTSELITDYVEAQEVFEPKQGLGYARNTGVRKAKGEWVVFIDDDGVPAKDFALSLEKAIASIDKSVVAIGGLYVGYYESTPPRWFNHSNETNFKRDGEFFELKPFKEYISGGIMAIRKEIIVQFGYFPVNVGMSGKKIGYGEETNLFKKIYANGHKIVFSNRWKMKHVVLKYKYSLLWQLKKCWAKGRDEVISNVEIDYRGVGERIKRQLKALLKKIIYDKKYYIENLLIDLSDIVLRFLANKIYQKKAHSYFLSSRFPFNSLDFSDKELIIILPVFNRLELTTKFLEQVQRQSFKNYVVLIVDNGHDNTGDILEAKYINVINLKGHSQLWWGSSLQFAINFLKTCKLKNDLIVHINNDDVIFDNDYLEVGIKLLKDEGGVVCSQAISDKDSFDINKGIRLVWKDLNFNRIDDKSSPNCLSTRGIFMNFNDIISIGEFVPKVLPHYLSDYEFTVRAYQKGFKLTCPDELRLTSMTDETGIHTLKNYGIFKIWEHLLDKRNAQSPFIYIKFSLLRAPWKYKFYHLLKYSYRTVKILVKSLLISLNIYSS